ncbi:MAG: nucleotidyl transferase AbiEii/AbiGii toxin family protein [Bacteroidia bacterium]|nr:nucleotidyl transferase AbiEii/AbiGii toxin family protein [Bacteroidia bacterium]
MQIDLKNIPNPEIRIILEQLHKAFKEHGIEFYMIGARAKDFWLSAKNMPPKRFTEDIDFAILLDNFEQFEKLLNFLEHTGKFIKSINSPHRLYTSESKYMIDIIPFGNIEKAYYVTFKDKEKTRISTLGLNEVFRKSVPFFIDKNFEILTASIPGLIILKLIAWNDRPEARQKDLKDIAFFLKNYFDMHEDLIYEKYTDLFNGERDIDQIAMLALGREIKKKKKKSGKLKKVIIEILKAQLELREQSIMIQIFALEINTEVDKIVNYIELILKGIIY